MKGYTEIKVKDLKEGQRFWVGPKCFDADIERIIKDGKSAWADGSIQNISQLRQTETVYIKSIINTGDTMSLQDELKALKLKQDHAKASIGGMEQGCLKREFDINALEIKIADEAKPKLRHGDYGYNGNSKACMVNQLHDGHGNKLTVSNSSESYTYVFRQEDTADQCRHFDPKDVLGNIFDDLKAMQEDLTEFEVDGTIFKLLGDTLDVTNTNSCNGRIFLIAEMDAIVLGLRQMQGTYLRKQQKVSE